MPSHFSLNLKTLCPKQTGVVLSIALVHFNADRILKGMEVCLSVEEQVKAGRTINTDRLHWWFDQMRRPDLPAHPFPTKDINYPPRAAIRRLNAFIMDNGSMPEKPNVPVNFIWCRGVNFDWAILENLSHQFEVGLPFRHNAIKDQRQFCDTHVQHMPEKRRNAEYDAIYHALNIQSVARLTEQKLD